MKPFAIYMLFLVLVVTHLPVFGQGQGDRLKTVLISMYDQHGFVPLEKYDFTYHADSGALPPNFDVEEYLQFMPLQELPFPDTPKLLKYEMAIVSEFDIHNSAVVIDTNYYLQTFDKAGRCVRRAYYNDFASATNPGKGQAPEHLYTFSYHGDGRLALASKFSNGDIDEELYYNANGYCDIAHEFEYGDTTLESDLHLAHTERKPAAGGGYMLIQTYKDACSYVFKIQRTYNAIGYVTALQYQQEGYVDNKRQYTYDRMGRKIMEVSYNVDTSGKQKPSHKQYYRYNDEGLLMRIEEKLWDDKRNQWVDGIFSYSDRQDMPYMYFGVHKTELFYEPVK